MTATTSLLEGEQRQPDDYTSWTMKMRATIAITMMAKTPAHQWQQCHHNKSNNIIAMKARMPAHQ
jgi:hypothetical protein